MSNDFPHAGTVIHGTHRPQDVIPALLGKLEELAPERAGDFRASWPNLTSDPSCVERDDHMAEIAPELVQELFIELDMLAPEGWHFGSLEGDGADFGFWRTATDDDLPNMLAASNTWPDVPQVTRCNGRWSNYA